MGRPAPRGGSRSGILAGSGLAVGTGVEVAPCSRSAIAVGLMDRRGFYNGLGRRLLPQRGVAVFIWSPASKVADDGGVATACWFLGWVRRLRQNRLAI